MLGNAEAGEEVCVCVCACVGREGWERNVALDLMPDWLVFRN